MSYYKDNIEHLDRRFSAIVQRLISGRDVLEESPTFIVGKAQDGLPTVQVLGKNKGKKFLHSFYNPQQEGEFLSVKVYGPQITLFVIIGFGFGYHALALHTKLKPMQKLLIIEPHPNIFKQALHVRDYTALFADRRVHIIVDNNLLTIREKIKSYVCALIPFKSTTITVDFLPFYERWDVYREVCKTIRVFVNTNVRLIIASKKDVVTQIDYLRTSGLGKTFMGTYEKCLASFRERARNNTPLQDAEVGLLLTYFLFSFQSYVERFEAGTHT